MKTNYWEVLKSFLKSGHPPTFHTQCPTPYSHAVFPTITSCALTSSTRKPPQVSSSLVITPGVQEDFPRLVLR